MSARYKIDGPWDTQTVETLRDGVTMARQTADLRDTRTGALYGDGAHRVTVDGKAVPGGTFKGESAWNAADRLALDIEFAVRGGYFNRATRRIERR